MENEEPRWASLMCQGRSEGPEEDWNSEDTRENQKQKKGRKQQPWVPPEYLWKKTERPSSKKDIGTEGSEKEFQLAGTTFK